MDVRAFFDDLLLQLHVLWFPSRCESVVYSRSLEVRGYPNPIQDYSYHFFILETCHGSIPQPVIVTIRITTFWVGNPNINLSLSLLSWGPRVDPKTIPTPVGSMVMVYLPIWMVDFQGKCIDKYTCPMGILWDLPNHLGFPALSLHILFQPPAFLFEPSLQSCQEPVASERIFVGSKFGNVSISAQFYKIPQLIFSHDSHAFYGFLWMLLNILFKPLSPYIFKIIFEAADDWFDPDHSRQSRLPWVVPNCPKQNAIGQLQSYP